MDRSKAFEVCSLDAPSNHASDDTVQPVVVGSGGAEFPFIDDAILSHSLDAELRRYMLGN